MNIADVIAVSGRAGFFNRDLAAVKAGAKADGFAYPGRPVSPGFTRVVQPGTVISVMLLLNDGQVAFGDCMDVILSGVAGRDPLFRAEDHLDFLRTVMRDIGLKGEKLIAYAEGIVRRIREIGDPDYRPIIHLDVYGTIGELFGDNTDAIARYLGELKAAVEPHELLVESFTIAPSREA